MDTNNKIKNRRQELNLTLEDVAKHVGVSKTTVSRWETGEISNMRRDKIGKLAEILKVRPNFIMGLEEKIPNKEIPHPKLDTSVLTEAELEEYNKVTKTNRFLFFNNISDEKDLDLFKEAVIEIILKQRGDKSNGATEE